MDRDIVGACISRVLLSYPGVLKGVTFTNSANDAGIHNNKTLVPKTTQAS